MDFAAEKAKIEAEFTALEEQLDNGTREKADIEKDFDALTKKADTLRRLQETESAAEKVQAAAAAPLPAVPQNQPSLAPLRAAPRTAPRDPSKPTMAVVHWKGVTKEQFLEYREKLVSKYGSGPDMIKSVERIPNRILITAPIAEVMGRILEDEELDPRPEPYKLPSRAAAPAANTKLTPLAPLKPIQAAAGTLPPLQQTSMQAL